MVCGDIKWEVICKDVLILKARIDSLDSNKKILLINFWGIRLYNPFKFISTQVKHFSMKVWVAIDIK